MHYLVTGGAGFIGSHLSEELLKRGHKVVVLDNFLTGQRSRVPSGANLIEVDIRRYQDIAGIFEGIDGVFHTAAYPRVPRSIAEPVLSHEVNINGTFNVLEACRHAGVRRLVYSASSTAYGDQPRLPLHEDMKPNPMSPYGAQKLAGEGYCSVYSQLYNVETVILRYFGVYGKYMQMDDKYAMAIPAFLKARMERGKVEIYGSGNQTRDFTHVSDVVRANILAMESSKVGSAEIINIGAGNNISVNDLAQAIGVPAQYREARYEPKDTLADNSRAREVLGWEPTISFSEGIQKLCEYYDGKRESRQSRGGDSSERAITTGATTSHVEQKQLV